MNKAANEVMEDSNAAIAIEHDKVTCSYQNLAAEIEKQVPDLDAIARLSAGEVHQKLCDSFLGVAVNYSTTKNLIADAKRRMQEGESVGGCKTWKSYVDTYLCKPDENLPAVIRVCTVRLTAKASTRSMTAARTARGRRSRSSLSQNSLSRRFRKAHGRSSYRLRNAACSFDGLGLLFSARQHIFP